MRGCYNSHRLVMRILVEEIFFIPRTMHFQDGENYAHPRPRDCTIDERKAATENGRMAYGKRHDDNGGGA